MFGLFSNSAREGQRLAKDARAIIAMERESSAMERLNAIAELVDAEWTKYRERIAARPADIKVAKYDLRQKNGIARRSNQKLFSALTLVIIAVRAEELGEHGTDASTVVREFIDKPGVDSNRISA